MGSTTNGMTQIVETAGAIVSFAVDAVGDIGAMILGTPVLLITFGVGFTFLGVKMIKSFLRR